MGWSETLQTGLEDVVKMCRGGVGIESATQDCTENCTDMIGMWLSRWMLHMARTS